MTINMICNKKWMWNLFSTSDSQIITDIYSKKE